MLAALTAKGGSTGDLMRPDRGSTQVLVLWQAKMPDGISGRLSNDAMMGKYVSQKWKNQEEHKQRPSARYARR